MKGKREKKKGGIVRRYLLPFLVNNAYEEKYYNSIYHEADVHYYLDTKNAHVQEWGVSEARVLKYKELEIQICESAGKHSKEE